VRGFVDLGERAGIKYSFAAMGKGDILEFKDIYEEGASMETIEAVLEEVFGEILRPFYAAAQYERLPLLEHYWFSPQWADSVREDVKTVLGEGTGDEDIVLPDGSTIPSLVKFYTGYVPSNLGRMGEYHYVSMTHGDLNGANILIDSRDNVWLIDFFHTARGHVLKDLIKLENDILYIYTQLESDEDLAQAVELSKALTAVQDLRAPLGPLPEGITLPALKRAWNTISILRKIGAEFVREDRNPVQSLIGLLRFSVHTMKFDESSAMQKKWALYASCLMAEKIQNVTNENRELRLGWLTPDNSPVPSRLGMTLCPGRRDHGRNLEEDIAVMKREGVKVLLGLLTEDELKWAGVPNIAEACEAAGIRYIHEPIADQGIPSLDEGKRIATEIGGLLAKGVPTVIHCVGGLGRTGTLASLVLTDHGSTADEALNVIRSIRGPRAVESKLQEDFVRSYGAEAQNRLR
jgi:protein-tyrosine phosphatase